MIQEEELEKLKEEYSNMIIVEDRPHYETYLPTKEVPSGTSLIEE